VDLIAEPAASLVADTMFALSAPSRVQILGCLLERPLAVSEITAMLGMEQSAASHQLRVLREADLVSAERHGKRRVYAIASDSVRELLAAAYQLKSPPDTREDQKLAASPGKKKKKASPAGPDRA